MILFFALCFVGVAIAGFCAFLIFWPLSLVHIRDRQPALQTRLGPGAFARPAAWAWLLRGGYRAAGDRNLDGLATPARVALWTTIGGLGCAGLLTLFAMVTS
ncbi:hypothetical protein [Vulcaniibacterium tengchongense]|uniref:Transmembrane protein n=1 Tax=Vulcaniibacterium tengchongense TaxID=1273429 RepID=A0A3N4VWV3_9GAMM|nr:hypothetical protein [Vulcaniibacterium tengchongense]RPE81567.1 hypothetical protein EDC50_0758 [Vulcaniibacterium tengchongense]